MKPTISVLQEELANARQRVNEQTARIAQKDIEIAKRDAALRDIVAERDRIIRLVDQFTSISIVAQGSTLNAPAVENQPAKLRRT